jgi:hypothetical protein
MNKFNGDALIVQHGKYCWKKLMERKIFQKAC